jgi:hypothetical protein
MDILNHKSIPEAKAGEKGGCYGVRRTTESIDGKI